MSENGANGLAVTFPPELIEAIAQRTAEILADRLDEPSDGWFDADAAAEHLRCPRSRIYELVERRKLRPHRDGRRLLFRRADLDAIPRRSEEP